MKRYLELFFRHPIGFCLPMVLALAAGVAYAEKAPPMYTARATVFCDTSLPNVSSLQQAQSPGGVTPCQDKASILQEFLHAQSFVNNVARRATHAKQIDDLTADAIVRTITTTVSGPQILTISAKSTSPPLAANTVQAVFDEFTDELRTVLQQRGQSAASAYKNLLDSTAATLTASREALNGYIAAHGPSPTDTQQAQLAAEVALAQQQHDAAQTSYNQALLAGPTAAVDPTAFHIIDRPTTPTSPESKKKQLVLVAAGSVLGGAVITIIALILLVVLDRSVRETGDLGATFDLIGSVPRFTKGALSSRRRHGRESSSGFNVPASLVDACRTVLRHLKLAERGVQLSAAATAAPVSRREGSASIAVTSCLRGEGRSSIAAGIAEGFRQGGLRVVLAELDLEHPSFATQFGLPSGPGVAEYLRDGKSIDECLTMPDDGSVGVLVAGDAKGGAADLLIRLPRASLIQDIGGLCDVMVADLPPALSNDHVAALSDNFSTVLLVVRTGTATVSDIRRVVDSLEKPPVVIINAVDSSLPRPLRAFWER